MKFDYTKLLDKIIEVHTTQCVFAHEMGLSERTISLKLNNKVRWKDVEIFKAVALLKLNPDDIIDYFITHKIYKSYINKYHIEFEYQSLMEVIKLSRFIRVSRHSLGVPIEPDEEVPLDRFFPQARGDSIISYFGSLVGSLYSHTRVTKNHRSSIS